MQRERFSQKGFSLVELLVSMAILGLVLAGIYGLLNSAYQTYMDTRRRAESQQTARIVMDYITFRLREIDGAKSPPDPWNCRKCHDAGLAVMPTLTSLIPCPQDVNFPRTPLNYRLATDDLTGANDITMPDLPAGYNTYVTGSGYNNEYNRIDFVADLLPLHGFSETFTDSPRGDPKRNGRWDFANNVDSTNNTYDYGETELLEDLNENSYLDFFGENWSLYLKPAEDGKTYALMEFMNFSTLQPRADATKINGKLRYNRSAYPDEGYVDENGDPAAQVVAEGIISLKIREVPRVANPSAPNQYFSGKAIDRRCRNQTNATGCHGSNPAAGATNVYGNASSFDLATFAANQATNRHRSWNIRGFSVEVKAAARKGGKTHITTMTQFIIPRNLEINQ